MYNYNCWSLESTGLLSKGIPISGSDKLVISTQERSITVPLRAKRNGNVDIENGLLLAARGVNNEGGRNIIPRFNWGGALLLVKTAELRFREGLFLGNINNAWPGIESMAPTFVQVGRRNAVDQAQLVSIGNEQFVYACDLQKRYIKLYCRGGLLTLRTGSVKEFGRLLARRAVKRLYTHHGLLWTRHALQEIGEEQLWSPELAARLAKLDANTRHRKALA